MPIFLLYSIGFYQILLIYQKILVFLLVKLILPMHLFLLFRMRKGLLQWKTVIVMKIREKIPCECIARKELALLRKPKGEARGTPKGTLKTLFITEN